MRERIVGFPQIRLDFKRLVCNPLCFYQYVRIAVVLAVQLSKCKGFELECVGIIWIEFSRECKLLDGEPATLASTPSKIFGCLEIKLVRLRIFRPAFGKLFL